MISDQKQQERETDFDIDNHVSKESIENLVVESLIYFYTHIKTVLLKEGVSDDDSIMEKLFNQELSSCLQIKLHPNYGGTLTIHEENTKRSKLIKSRQNKKRGKSEQIDIAIKNAKLLKRVYLIEGKRLYKKGDSQYVHGKNGGIQRFKAEGHAEEFNHACMVGFVQEYDFIFWRSRINNWLGNKYEDERNTIFVKREKLEPFIIQNDIISKCLSVHERITKEPIQLTHLWVYIHPSTE